VPLTESPSEGRLVEAGGTRLFVIEKSQEGYPLLCVHGGPGLDHWLFADYLDPLATDVRLVLLDLRGHGMSEEALPETITLPRLAQDVAELADALRLREYALLAHSFGARVGLRVALERPSRVSRLVLVTPALAWREVRPAGEAATDDDVRASFESFAREDFAEPEAAGEYLRRAAPMQPRAQAVRALAGQTDDVELSAIEVPTLVLGGRHDASCPLEVAERVADELADAELRVFERSGHYPFVEEQDAFLAAVREFVV
jgi:proline iminopeptidase